MPQSAPFQSSFFTVVQNDDVFIVTVDRDQLKDDDNLEQFSQDFNLLLEKHEITKIILHLSRVRYMTSMAIGKIISLHRKLQRTNGTLVLCELAPDVSSTLEAAKLLTYFTTSSDLTAALAKFPSLA